jgi:hypothetical protein
MSTTSPGLSIHQCVYCGAFRDDEIDALLCGPCATMLGAGSPPRFVAAETSEPADAPHPVAAGARQTAAV